MSDLIDDANYVAEVMRLAALANVPKPKPPSTVCLNCEEPLFKRFNFCDIDCRNDWELRNRHRPATANDDE